MTWGELAGTPMRLEDEDAALAAARGPHFSVPEPRSRDELARRMAQKVLFLPPFLSFLVSKC